MYLGLVILSTATVHAGPAAREPAPQESSGPSGIFQTAGRMFQRKLRPPLPPGRGEAGLGAAAGAQVHG